MAEGFADAASQVRAVLRRPKRKQRRDAGGNTDVLQLARGGVRQVTEPCLSVGNQGNVAQAQMLAEALVVAENEELVLDDRAAQRPAELVALKLGDRTSIEEVARVEVAVAQELVNAAVKLVRAGCCDDTDLPARTFPIFGAIGVKDHIELAHGFHSEQLAARTARRDIDFRRACVLDAVEQVQVLLRTSSGDRKHVAE